MTTAKDIRDDLNKIDTSLAGGYSPEKIVKQVAKLGDYFENQGDKLAVSIEDKESIYVVTPEAQKMSEAELQAVIDDCKDKTENEVLDILAERKILQEINPN